AERGAGAGQHRGADVVARVALAIRRGQRLSHRPGERVALRRPIERDQRYAVVDAEREVCVGHGAFLTEDEGRKTKDEARKTKDGRFAKPLALLALRVLGLAEPTDATHKNRTSVSGLSSFVFHPSSGPAALEPPRASAHTADGAAACARRARMRG